MCPVSRVYKKLTTGTEVRTPAMKTLAVLSLCATVVLAHHFHTNRCLPAMGKYPFDEQKVRSNPRNFTIVSKMVLYSVLII